MTPKYDCGTHGNLTSRQIAEMAGVNPRTVLQRVDDGWPGHELVAPAMPRGKKRETFRDAIPANDCGPMMIACLIAKRYTKRAPTVHDLRRDFGMHRATAARWVRTWKDANGMP